MPHRRLAILPAVLAAAALTGAAHAAAPVGVVAEYRVTTPNSQPAGIVAGPDGAVWFTEFAGNRIGRVLPDGSMTEFPLPNPASAPAQITLGPDGNLWFTEQVGNRIGRITPAGVITEFPIPTAASAPRGIVNGPDGNLWFTEQSGQQIASITPTGSIVEHPLAAGTFPEQITVGQDGNLWFTEIGPDRIGRMSPAGTVLNEFPLAAGSNPDGIVEGPDGQVWFTESGANVIGHMRTNGAAGDFAVPTPAAAPKRIVAGFDANLWFTEPEGDKIARITPSGTVQEFPIPTPDSGPQYIAAGPGGMIWFSEAANKIGVATTGLDTVAPAVAIAAPADGAHLAQGASVAADYACDDRADGSGVVGCAGPVARGAALDTSTPGVHSFAVTATDLAGNVATVTRTYVVDAPPEPPAPPGPSGGPGLALTAATFRGSYVESELRGTLTVAGTAGAAARVEVRLRRAGGRTAATLAFRTAAGPFRRTLRLPARLLPGRLAVSATAPGLAVTVAPAAGAVGIAPPPAGIADVAVVSIARRGPAATSVRGAFRQLWVRFHLAVRPAPGRPLTVTWLAPGARRGRVVGRPNQAAIESFVRSAAPLAKGRWRVVLRAGPTVVRRLAIRLD